MPIHLLPIPVQDLLEALHGEINGFVTTWETLAKTRKVFPLPRRKSTIYRCQERGCRRVATEW